MKVPAVFLAIFFAVQAVGGSNTHDGRALSSHHAHSVQRAPVPVGKVVARQCNHDSEVDPPKTTAQPKDASASKPQSSDPTSTGKTRELINVRTSCGGTEVGATKETTKTTGPNGSIEWLNCGIMDTDGWKPPKALMSDIVMINLTYAMSIPDSPFKACEPFVGLFEQYGRKYDIPPMLLASFALQESSCRSDVVGGAHEQGLMQITGDKCHDAPGGNCKDPEFNIKTAASYFANVLKDHGGNVIASIGSYNGWFPGMTYYMVTKAVDDGCCWCQQNLDYLHQFLNALLQAIARPVGKYHNLDKCKA